MALSKEEQEKRKEERRIKKWNETHVIIDGEDYKLCNICEEYLPANTDNFYSNKSNITDGLNPHCIECTKKKSVKWAEENPDRRKELKNKYNQRDYTIERRRESSKLRRELGKFDEWLKNNPEKYGKYWRKKFEERTHDITDEEWNECKKYFDNSCAYCNLHISEHYNPYKGESRWTDLHREHVDHTGTNDLSNCIPACMLCNSEKWQFSIDVWYNESNPRYSEENYSRIVKWLSEDYIKFIK